LQSRDSSFFDFSLDLLPEDIFGTEEIPEYILSDSSTEEENATHEQKTNNQLCRRIQHLEHDLRGITARCSAERERRMNLQAVIGGEIFIPIRISCSSSYPMSDDNMFFFFRCVRQVQQPECRLGQLDGSCRTCQPQRFPCRCHGGLGAAEEGRDQEEKR
jgi:hypothetical protein